MPFGIGIWELVILMVLLLLVFGAKRLPEMGRSIGHGMREFKDAVTGKSEPDEPEKTELTPPPPPSTHGARRRPTRAAPPRPSASPKARPPWPAYRVASSTAIASRSSSTSTSSGRA